MNQGKLGVVKQEMASVNVYILGISKLKWTGMGAMLSKSLIQFPADGCCLPIVCLEAKLWSG